MSGKSYSSEEANYRLMVYKGTIYKFKIEFSGCNAGKNSMRKVVTPSESSQIDRAVGVLVHQKYRRTSLTRALRTTDFLIKCSERPWKIGKKVGFRLHGEELAVHDFMLLLNVVPKQKGVTVVSNGVSLRDKSHVIRAQSQGEIQQSGGTAQNGTTDIRQSSSSSQQGYDRDQQTSADQSQTTAQGDKPLPRQLRSSYRQRRDPSPKQMERITRFSPRRSWTNPGSARNVTSTKQMQKNHKVSPKQLRKSPRLLPSEKSPEQVQRSPTLSPGQFYSAANLSVPGKSPRQAKRHVDVSPRIVRKTSRICRASSTHSSPVQSLENDVIPEFSPRISRKRPGLCSVRSNQSTPIKSSEKRVIPQVSPRFLRRSPRLGSIRSSQSSPMKSPKRCKVLDRLDPSKPRQRSRSIGSNDNQIVKQIRSGSSRPLVSDVTATEKLLHPLDKEFVRREFEQEELRLMNLAKPSTTSAERKAWLLRS